MLGSAGDEGLWNDAQLQEQGSIGGDACTNDSRTKMYATPDLGRDESHCHAD